MSNILGKATLCMIGLGALSLMFPTLERLIRSVLNVARLNFYLQLFRI